MSKGIIISAGYGPATAHSVSRLFGSKGFSVACVGRTQATLDEGVKKLGAEGIVAASFVADCGDSEAVKQMVKNVKSTLGGKIAVLHWNAVSFSGGDLITDDASALLGALNVSCVGLIAAVQEALSDLKEAKGTVLVTGGSFSNYDPYVDQFAASAGYMGPAVSKAAQRKLTGLLHARLKPEGVMVGQVITSGAVKGTPFDQGDGSAIDANDLAECFWEIHDKREKSVIVFPER